MGGFCYAGKAAGSGGTQFEWAYSSSARPAASGGAISTSCLVMLCVYVCVRVCVYVCVCVRACLRVCLGGGGPSRRTAYGESG
jgi:hypothetical protein